MMGRLEASPAQGAQAALTSWKFLEHEYSKGFGLALLCVLRQKMQHFRNGSQLNATTFFFFTEN